MKTSRQPPPKGVRKFNRGQLNELEKIVGWPLLRRLVPKLEQAANAYEATEKRFLADRHRNRHTSSRHEKAAGRLERLASRVLKALADAYPLMPEAVSKRYVYLGAPGNRVPVLADLIGPMSPSLPWSFEAAKVAASGLVQQATAWRRRAHLDTIGRKGRNVGIRRYLATWTGRQLRLLDVPLSGGREGKFARTLLLVYELAGVQIPTEVYADVRYAIKMLALEK